MKHDWKIRYSMVTGKAIGKICERCGLDMVGVEYDYNNEEECPDTCMRPFPEEPEYLEIDQVEALLRDEFPNGHPDFIPLMVSAMKLHSDKNFDYAAGGEPLGNFDRVASIMGLYPNIDFSKPIAIALVYMLKQLDCVLHQLDARYESKIEGLEPRLFDVGVYAFLAILLAKDGKTEQNRIDGVDRKSDVVDNQEDMSDLGPAVEDEVITVDWGRLK